MATIVTFEDAIAAHQQKYEYEVCTEMPPLDTLPDGTVLGIVSYTHEASRRRWLRRDALVLDGVTASDAARIWLKTAYNLPLARRRDQFAPAAVPLLARPGTYANCVYVDIKSTYLAVVRAFGYDVEYRRGAYLAPETYRPPLPELIERNKRAYASIVACAASRESVMQRIEAGRLVTFRVRNMYYQPCLWSLTRDILLGVYSTLFWRGVRILYANTDGYIVREEDMDEAIYAIEAWGFRASVKARGNAKIDGVGAYSIGAIKSARFVYEPRRHFTPPLMPWTLRWLRRRAAPLLLRAAYGAK